MSAASMTATVQPRANGRFTLPPVQLNRCSVTLIDNAYGTTLCLKDARGSVDEYIRWAATPDMLSRSWWNPAHWNLHRERVDAHGNRWTTAEGAYVMDDFGFLVKVPE